MPKQKQQLQIASLPISQSALPTGPSIPLAVKPIDVAMLDLYTDYLTCSFGLTTATGMSAMLYGAIGHDDITRFLGARDYTSKDL